MFRDAGIDALITIGGDGSLTIARRLSDAGLRVIGVPKSIDNDLAMTDTTFGFDTAVEVATESIGRLFTTATSHSRVFVVEVMGRYAGWIALNSGMAAGAHAILIPEIPFVLEPVAAMIARREERGARFAIVVVAEGARPARWRAVRDRQVNRSGRAPRRDRCSRRRRARATHRQGGPHDGARSPAARWDADRARPSARPALRRRRRARRRGGPPRRDGGPRAPQRQLRPAGVCRVQMHSVPLDCDTIISGRDLGVSFGDD